MLTATPFRFFLIISIKTTNMFNVVQFTLTITVWGGGLPTLSKWEILCFATVRVGLSSIFNHHAQFYVTAQFGP